RAPVEELTKTNARPIKRGLQKLTKIRAPWENQDIPVRVIYAVKARPGVAIPSSRWHQTGTHHQGKRPPWARGVGPVPGRAGMVPRGLAPGVFPGQGRVGGLPGEPGPGITAVTPKGIRQRATPCVNTKKAPSRQHGGRGPSFVPLGPSPRARG